MNFKKFSKIAKCLHPDYEPSKTERERERERERRSVQAAQSMEDRQGQDDEMTNLPTLIEAEVDTMVDAVTHWIDVVGALLTSDAGHLLLRNQIRRMLQEGILETLKVVTAAEQGHQDADLALRELGAEMLDRGEMPNAALRSYLVKALVMAPVSYPPGRNIADTWVRDIGIAVMVAMVMAHWPHLKATRNRAAKRPSAATIVALALSKRGYSLTEWQVERVFGNHNKLAGRLSASMGGI